MNHSILTFLVTPLFVGVVSGVLSGLILRWLGGKDNE